MKLKTKTNHYETMVILSPSCTEQELKKSAFGYAQQLKRLGANNISVISRGCRTFAYEMKNFNKGYFIEVFFQASPEGLALHKNKLKLDKNVLRYSIGSLQK